MTTKTHDTIIVGAGISGLACAKRLHEHGKDFLILSKDIGGRILTSNDGSVNYGAFFACSDYHHVLQYVKLRSRIKLSDFCFHDNNKWFVLYEPKLLLYLFQFMKVLKLLYNFRRALRKLRKASETISQKRAIENDDFLHGLYMKDATDFIMEHHLQKGTDTYLSKALYSTTFSKVTEMNAFSYLQFLLPLITPIYTFTFEKERMIAPFQDQIALGSVTDVRYKNGYYKIKFNDQRFSSKNIVFATDIRLSQRFAGVKETNKPISTNMLHIKGKPKDIVARKKYHLFSPIGDVQAIADLQDGTYLLYYKQKRPKLEEYFFNPQVLASHFWDFAGTINGHTLIETNRGNNMYLIGDYNVAGLEESYITGLYCANQIIQLE